MPFSDGLNQVLVGLRIARHHSSDLWDHIE